MFDDEALLCFVFDGLDDEPSVSTKNKVRNNRYTNKRGAPKYLRQISEQINYFLGPIWSQLFAGGEILGLRSYPLLLSAPDPRSSVFLCEWRGTMEWNYGWECVAALMC